MAGRIVWALSLGLLLGVFLRSLFLFSWPFALFAILLGVVCAIYLLTDISRRDLGIICAVFFFALAGGVFRMDGSALVGDSELSARIGHTVEIIGRVSAEPDVREKNTRIFVDADTLIYQSGTTTVSGGILVIALPHTEVGYGDTVRTKGKLGVPEPFDTDAGRTFNYPMFLAKDGILYTLSFAEVDTLEQGRGNPLKKGAIWLKQIYLRGLGQVLPEPEAGLAGGITVGDKRSIGQELSDTFLKVSLIHIVVLSGYNMTVVINAAAHVLTFLPRYGKFAVSGVIVALFILMTGGAASATRAGAMALLATYARLTGRTFLSLRVLAVVACAMTLWNPYLLAFDPGFQLSVLATLGLILLTPFFTARLSWVSERWGMREILASTLGTQAMVLPLLLYQNGLLSIVSIPANLLALLAVPLAMLASFIAALGGILLGSYTVPLALPALVLLKYIIAVAVFFESLPYSSVIVPAFGAWLMFLAYSILFGMFLVSKKKAARD